MSETSLSNFISKVLLSTMSPKRYIEACLFENYSRLSYSDGESSVNQIARGFLEEGRPTIDRHTIGGDVCIEFSSRVFDETTPQREIELPDIEGRSGTRKRRDTSGSVQANESGRIYEK